MSEFLGHNESCKRRLTEILVETIRSACPNLRSVVDLKTTELSAFIDAIVAHAHGEEPSVKSESAKILGQLPELAVAEAVHLSDGQVDRVTEALIANLQHEDQVEVTTEALTSYGPMRGAVIADALVKLLPRKLDAAAIISALSVLQHCGVDEASQGTEAVADLLQAENKEVAVEAAKTLGYLGVNARAVVSDLLSVVGSVDADPDFANHAARALVAVDRKGTRISSENIGRDEPDATGLTTRFTGCAGFQETRLHQFKRAVLMLIQGKAGETTRNSKGRSMLSVKQVARKLAVSQKTVYQLISSGKLKAHRIGTGRGTIRVSPEQLSAFLADSEQTTERHRGRTPLRHLV